MERRLGAAAAGGRRGRGLAARAGGSWVEGALPAYVPLAGGRGWGWWGRGVWGLGYPARVTRLTFLCLGRWGSMSRPERRCE